MLSVQPAPIVTCTAEEAREITTRIKRHAESLWSLLLEAHERQAWAALGYASWADYVTGELNIGRQYSYRVIDQGRVIRELEAAVSPMGDTEPIQITEREAREIKPHLGMVTERVRERTNGVAPERVQTIVSQVIEETREELDDRERRNAWAREVNARQPVDFDPAENEARMQVTTQAIKLVQGSASLIPREVIRAMGPDDYPYFAPIGSAIARLTELAQALKEAE